MADAFLIRAALAGLGLALAAGPLGCFVVWRRMAYFGDATAHAAILGVALALGFSASIFAGTLAVALLMALTVSALAGRGWAMDTTLGVLAHSALAFGPGRGQLRARRAGRPAGLSLRRHPRGRPARPRADLGRRARWCWPASPGAGPALLTATLSEDLAQASGIDPARERLVLTLALALVVAVAIKVVGALLIAAMLIVPAAAARGLARTPEAMALFAALIAAVSALAGLWASLRFDTPAGPSIVVAAALVFAASASLGGIRRRG